MTFLDFWISQGSVVTYCRWGGNLYAVYVENFSYESIGERILKVDRHLPPKLLSNINGLFFWDTVLVMMIIYTAVGEFTRNYTLFFAKLWFILIYFTILYFSYKTRWDYVAYDFVCHVVYELCTWYVVSKCLFVNLLVIVLESRQLSKSANLGWY